MKDDNFLKILNDRNFVKLWLAQIFSLLSANILNFVLIGKIYSLTQSTTAVGFYLFFYYLPTMILGPFVGVFIDNWNKKSIFIFSNLIQSIIVLSYLFTKERVWPLYTIVLLYSLGDEFFNPSVGTSIPSLVKKDHLSAANSLFFFTSQGSLIMGFFAGGVMLKFLNNTNYIFFTVSFFLLLATVLSFSLPTRLFSGNNKIKPVLGRTSNLGSVFDFQGFWQQTKEGYFFIKNEPLVLFPILLLAGLQGMVGIALIIFPSLAKVLKIEFADSAYLVILPAIFGAMIGSWILQKIIKKARKNSLILSGLFSLGIECCLIVLASIFLRNPIILVLPLILFVGGGYIFVYIPLQTLIQEKTPIDVRGRVFGTLNTIVNLAGALPMLFLTTLVDFLGVRLILFLLGIGLLFLTFYAHQRKQAILTLSNKNENS